MEKLRFAFAALPAILVLVSALLVNGQTCNLSLSAYSFDDRSKAEPITGVSIKVGEGSASGKIIPAANGQPGFFENLKPGKYLTTVSKEGFKTTTKTFRLDCERAWERTVQQLVFLWKGPPEQIQEMNDDIFTVEEPNAMAKGASFPPPNYPLSARAVRASGSVEVQVLVNEIGRVVYANAVRGHPLLRGSAVQAARMARFKPMTIEGTPINITGIIVYNFVP